jgi:O-antigen/teichoic acid export membrane protein
LVPGPRMRFTMSRVHNTELLSSGKWIMLSSASGLLSSQGDRLVLSSLLTAHQMGLYAIAWTLSDMSKALVQRLHGQITLPVMAELFRNQPEKARQAYYRYRRPTDAVMFTAAGFLWVAGAAVIDGLYDVRYAGAGWILQVLALSSAAMPFQMINQAFIANGDWPGFSRNSMALSGSFIAAIPLGFLLGGWQGAIWGYALHPWPAVVYLLARAHTRGWIDFRREFALTPFLLVGAALGYGTIWIAQRIGLAAG